MYARVHVVSAVIWYAPGFFSGPEAIEMTVQQSPLIWRWANQSGGRPHAENAFHFRTSYEMVIMAHNPDPTQKTCVNPRITTEDPYGRKPLPRRGTPAHGPINVIEDVPHAANVDLPPIVAQVLIER